MAVTIALLTDFGTKDIYVGVMKGVMAGICPDAHLIDLTHEIAPQNIRQAAFNLMNAYHYFPKQTVFLVVVDPGVGSARRAIAVTAGDYTFVAPDNGVLTYTLAHLGEPIQAVALVNPEYRLSAVSGTFHGRDIFAPAAAHLASGVPLMSIGEPLEEIVTLEMPEFSLTERQISGEIIHIDHFGNAVSSIGQFKWLDDKHLRLQPIQSESSLVLPANSVTIRIGEHLFSSICRTYSEVQKGEGLVLIGSEGYLEIAANLANAAQHYQINHGDALTLILKQDSKV